MASIASALSPGSPLYFTLYVALIIFFTYFYTAVSFNPVELADNMQKYGGFIPGIRPGRPTVEYLDRTLSRITLWGALFLAFVAVVPDILTRATDTTFIWRNSDYHYGRGSH